MKILYASSACSKRRFFELFPVQEKMPGQQAQKYHRLMLEGIARNGIDVVALTSPPMTRQNSPTGLKRVPPDSDKGVTYHYLSVLNFSLIKNVAILAQSFATACRYLNSNKDAVVVCDVLNFSVATGALLAAKLFRRSNTGIVTDIPSLLSTTTIPVVTRAVTAAMRRYDSYVFLTKEMDTLVNRRRVPSVIIEGQVDIDMINEVNDLASKRNANVCLYAGAVDERYGLSELLEGFLMMRTRDCELHIYGSGDYAQTLRRIAQGEPRVKYFGQVPNDRVVKEQLRAMLLINPRPTTKAFTKYSFPSKNMEYIASGTPLLTTLLPGMPREYLPYVYVLVDEGAEGIAAELDRVLALGSERLHAKGMEAKEFALAHKNNVVQAGRLVDMITSAGRRPGVQRQSNAAKSFEGDPINGGRLV